MEIDAPSSKAAGGSSDEECTNNKNIKIHPLTIIGISDHHTRVISGGSALPRNAPVVGLLFGNRNIADNSISIVDAEEMEYPEGDGLSESHEQNIVRKIDLHQKVFPKHVVVGWYRVHTGNGDSSNDSSDVVPTEDDLRMNQQEMAQYCGEGVVSPLFVLMNAASPEYTGVSDDNDAKKATSQNSELDDALPLTVYETLLSEGGGGGGSAFVNASFELETHEPERIAVEKVFNTQSTASAASSQPKDAASDKDDKKQPQKDSSSKPTYVRPPSELEVQLTSLQSSIRSMNVRMSLLLEFLQKVERGELPPDNALLRSIDGLLQQLPLVLAALKEGTTGSGGKKKKPLDELENDFTDTMLLSYLTAVAKTAKSVHVYSEKFHGVFGSGKSEIGRRTLY